jgi:hypothetical protein
MSKSRQTTTEPGAPASPSKSTQKELDIERRFIDDLMTLGAVTAKYPKVGLFELGIED